MTQHGPDARDEVEGSTFDVVICGGGLAGLTLGLQLRQEFPDLRVLTLERVARPLPDGCHKVGESSVELGSSYFMSLGLTEYLKKHQLFKHGLRFFPGGGEKPLHERFEIGPMQEPIVPSYQLDRGSFESDLRAFNQERGVVLLEGCVVKDAEIGADGALHTVYFEMRDEDEAVRKRRSVQTRWLVDATGRHALLRKRMKLTRGSRHAASAGWYRIEGKLDINDMVPAEERRWHDAPFASERWRSTNHLMGPGYWVWVIPLSSGMTSIGAVIHNELHSFDDVRSLERVQGFIAKHEPHLFEILKGYEVKDFLALKDYSHQVGRAWSTERWAMVGEAGAFVDPLYSPGSDFIAYANTFTTELIRVDREGGDLETRTRELNLQYRALVSGNIDVYARSAPVYGHPSALLAKVYWDNFAYWSYSCQYFMRKIWKLTGAAVGPYQDVGLRIVELSGYMQELMREWALLAPEQPQPGSAAMPRFPSILVDAHLALNDDMDPSQTLTYMQKRVVEGEEIAAELLVRVLGELGPEKAAQLVERAGVARWRVQVSPARLGLEAEAGMARRHALSPIARDVERSLGRSQRLLDEATLRTLLAANLQQTDNEAAVSSVHEAQQAQPASA
jgi:flavin-dependent dehydrogenase